MAAAAATFAASLEPSFDIDKLSYEIFSILESRFLFGYDPDPKLFLAGDAEALKPSKFRSGKVRILSVDAEGATDGILAGKSLALLEDSLRRLSGDPEARIADFFDVAAGSGAGGVLAALLFTRGTDGRPLLSASDALRFIVENRRPAKGGLLRRVFRRSKAEGERIYRKAFSDYTLKDTLKTVLIPCFDVVSNAPFVFSRADALETDGYDFSLTEVCSATWADRSAAGAFGMRSIDGRTKIVAVDGGVAMSNPTAVAITHVLNNKMEFPSCRGVEDLLVLSLGSGESDSGSYSRRNLTPSARDFIKIAGDGVSDTVDQAISMAFGDSRESNYVRIQGQTNILGRAKTQIEKGSKWVDEKNVMGMAEKMLAQKNVESVLFQGKRIGEKTNAEKLEYFAGELVKEQERRKTSIFPTVLLKQLTPRTSSATTATTTTTTSSSSRLE